MIELKPVFKPLFTTDKSYIILTGGRNCGKSFGVKTWEPLLTYEKGHRILSTRYTLTSAKDSIIPETTSKLELLGVSKHFYEVKSGVKNMITGSEILFRGIKTSSGSQTAKLKSLHNISTWVLDEAEELVDEDEFDTIDLSIRSANNQNRVVIILNPTSMEHWIWKRWFANSFKYIDIEGFKIPVSTHPEVCHIHTTYHDNIENIPASFLKILERMKLENPKKYRHKILGGWLEKAEGVIFPEWTEEKFDESLPYIYGMDFGVVDPTTRVKVAVDSKRKRIYLKELFYESGMRPSLIAEMLRATVGEDDLIVADSAERLTINEMIYEGFNMQKAVKGPDSIRQGIRLMQDYELVVDPDSHNLKTELNNYVWAEKKSETPEDDYNHLIDPIRYCLQILIKQDQSFVI